MRSLIKFLPANSPLEQRRARVLSITLLTLIVLVGLTLIEVLFLTAGGGPRRTLYLVLITVLIGLLTVAYLLNRAKYDTAAAQLTVACGMLGPWGAVFLDSSVIQGDFIPLIYTCLSLLLAAILLPVRQTVLLAVVEFLALLAFSCFIPASAGINWPSLFVFIFFLSVLSIVTTVLSHNDLQQIEQQNRRLAQSEAELREISIRDPLTGLYNRRFFEEMLEQELLLAQQQQSALSLVMLDVDHFKHYNDLYGHVEGDALLRMIATVLRSRIRRSDVVCRFGGEEFVLIMPGAPLAVAQRRAEFLRAEVKQAQAENSDQFPCAVTISLGVASYPEQCGSPAMLLQTADQALYRAKQAGRDRVVCAGLA